MLNPKTADGPELEDDLDEGGWLPDWARRWLRRSGIYVIIGLLLLAFLVLALADRVFHRIDTGHRGVRWSLFGGTVLDYDYPEGLRVISPLDRLYIYDVRVQEVNGTVIVLTSNVFAVLGLHLGEAMRPRPMDVVGYLLLARVRYWLELNLGCAPCSLEACAAALDSTAAPCSLTRSAT